MRRVILLSLLLCAVLSAEDEMRLPTVKEAAVYVDLIVVGEITKVHSPEKEPKPTVQRLVVRIEDVLKGKFKKGEELMAEFYAPTATSPGYNLPLPDEFAKVGNRVILFLKVVKEKKEEKKFYVNVSPPPESGKLSATDENIKYVKKVLEEIEEAKKEFEKAKKEFDKEQQKYKKKKSVTIKKPPMKVKRPSKEWFFVPLKAEKEMRLKDVINEEARKRIESEYEHRLIELRHEEYEARCTFYAMEVDEGWKMDELRMVVEKNIKEGYEGARITSRRQVLLYGKTPAWRFVWEAKVGGIVRIYMRYTTYVERNNAVYDIVMSAPKENYEHLEKDFSKIIRYFKF